MRLKTASPLAIFVTAQFDLVSVMFYLEYVTRAEVSQETQDSLHPPNFTRNAGRFQVLNYCKCSD